MSQAVRPTERVRRVQGLVVFDPVDDRPSEFGDPSTVPSWWETPARPVDTGLESSRPRPVRPRVARRAHGGWWPGLLVLAGIVGGGFALLSRLLR